MHDAFMKRTLLLVLLLSLVNYGVYGSATIAVWLFVTREDFVLAALPGIVALLGVVLQPWFLLFLRLPVIGPPVAAAISIMVYDWLDKRGVFSRVKPLLKGFKGQRMKVFLIILVGLGALLFYLRMIDFPSLHHGIPDSVQWHLAQHHITPDENRLYTLGSFVDREWLWFARMTPEDVAMFIKAFQLAEVNASGGVPAQFFDMPPYWWRPQIDSPVTAYSTSDFPTGQRGPDGLHLFMLYDEESEELYVWVKDNF